MFSRNTAPADLSSPGLLDVAFSSELVEEGLNSDIIELDDETVVVARVVEHQPQRTQSLDEVREGIEASVKAEKSREAAEAWAFDVAQKVRAGESVESELSAKSVSWQTATNVQRAGGTLSRALVDTLFSLALEGDDKIDVATTVNGDVAVVMLEGVNPAPTLESELGESLKQRLAQVQGQRVYQQYIEALRASADVTISEAL